MTSTAMCGILWKESEQVSAADELRVSISLAEGGGSKLREMQSQFIANATADDVASPAPF